MTVQSMTLLLVGHLAFVNIDMDFVACYFPVSLYLIETGNAPSPLLSSNLQ